ncbi:GNAT family N-acetyltransferase [Rhodococcus sp. HNM0569]|uniref:GNAT family N-acetyltransferase n=1 Tax=Rhodococcus sp. HNM0569 TaxID=2716340 RepID=UPI00146B5544|nr:GNAT family N-acetyltransferase [Rhodococcus sp. HNM0569]NLU83412.1 N-acetyltransferase [Rhodococcus sp. HNM0569]
MTDTTNVTNAADQNRYEVRVGAELAGVADYVERDTDRGRERIFFHTEIGEQFGGRGLGGTLVEYALTDTARSGERIVPVCEFVASWLDKHPDFTGDVEPVTEAHHAAVADSRS